MIIKYISAQNYTVERDLSNEIITEWYINDELGYRPEGNLHIAFDDSKKRTINSGGIYPPVRDIVNFEEVKNWLVKNHPKQLNKAKNRA